ncbi:hypothetical protein GCM10007938_07950 [Vibrio zhanjiangensis]|uniref:Integrase n=1 Tax=Vibrio zhanjiangensis TaxID=1046128 RepID=A0ABQ6EV12_9VIBR|nr:hypothetical protein GCM10007938_07950 [Vibrio zhanjiangensis]
MFDHQRKYGKFIRAQGVGQKDNLADSVKSYVCYLKGVQKYANIQIDSSKIKIFYILNKIIMSY